MKILVIGLESAAPEILFGDERLTNFRRLMEGGCYGLLESTIPPSSVPAWLCMATSQDPGSLGMYGLRNRADYSYNHLQAVTSKDVEGWTIWDQVAKEGKRVKLIGVPLSCQPREQGGVISLTWDEPADINGFSTASKDGIKDEVYAMSRKCFDAIGHSLRQSDWDYFQFVETGLHRLQRQFWHYHDPEHRRYEPHSPYREVVQDYYLYLDGEVGKLFEILDEDTAILVMSGQGVQKLDGGLCVNEWLVREGLLVLNHYPESITSLSGLDVNWEKTRVWAQGGDCAQIHFNVQGREPRGVISPSAYEGFRDEMRRKLEAIEDDRGRRIGTTAFKPAEIYRTSRKVAPDLIVCFGGLQWRAISDVGYGNIFLPASATGLDGCGPAPYGSFILAASNNLLGGEVEIAQVLDLSPTLLDLGGYDIPASMQGHSLTAGKSPATGDSSVKADEEELIRLRLSGLGYIS